MFSDDDVVKIMFNLVKNPPISCANIIIYISKENYQLFLNYYKDLIKSFWDKKDNYNVAVSNKGMIIVNRSNCFSIDVIPYNGKECTCGKRGFFILFDSQFFENEEVMNNILPTGSLGGFDAKSIQFDYLKERI